VVVVKMLFASVVGGHCTNGMFVVLMVRKQTVGYPQRPGCGEQEG